MNFDTWEMTSLDEIVMDSFLDQLFRGDRHDHAAPYGPLRACVDDPLVDPDDLRQAIAGELWDATGMEDQPEWRQQSALMMWRKLGSSSATYKYNQRRADGGASLEEKFEVYYKPRRLNIRQDVLDEAAEEVAKLWPRAKHRIKPIDLEDSVDLRKDDTNFGYPRCTSDSVVNAYYYYCEANSLHNRGYPLANVMDYPCIGTSRTAAKGYHELADRRALSMYCAALVYLENQVRKPLFDEHRCLPEFVAWRGQDAVDLDMTRMFDASVDQDWLSADFTGFDGSVPLDVLTRVVRIMGEWFAPGYVQDLIRFCGEAFMRTGIYLPKTPRCPSGYYHGDERTGGIPSGSGWTNLVGSYANLMVFHYAAKRDGGSIVRARVNGDDGVFGFRGISSIARLSEILFDELGMVIKMDPAKNLISKDHVKFLQMDHHRDHRKKGIHVGERSPFRALIKMTGHERRLAKKRVGLREDSPVKWKGPWNSYRWLQQMDPCSNCPDSVFDGFVELHRKNDRYIEEALLAIIEGLPEVDLALSMLDSNDGERFTVASLRKSKVVMRLRELFDV